jgi:hypothetical protein
VPLPSFFASIGAKPSPFSAVFSVARSVVFNLCQRVFKTCKAACNSLNSVAACVVGAASALSATVSSPAKCW